MRELRLACVLGALLAMTGCASIGRFQTARTLAPGDTDVWVAGGFLYNQNVEERKKSGKGLSVGYGNFPVEVGVRRGVVPQLDLGIQTFLGLGLLVDAKYNFMPQEGPFALSLAGGFGGSAVDGQGQWALHAPLMILASYRIAGIFTPYASVGYGAYWIFNDNAIANPAVGSGSTITPAKREGYGDGLLSATVGLEFKVAEKVRLLVEYSYTHPVVNDRGDGFEFVANQYFIAGIQFGG
ncbi:MAG: outer membrane beta-barrel protein [Myxococcales bacterium]